MNCRGCTPIPGRDPRPVIVFVVLLLFLRAPPRLLVRVCQRSRCLFGTRPEIPRCARNDKRRALGMTRGGRSERQPGSANAAYVGRGGSAVICSSSSARQCAASAAVSYSVPFVARHWQSSVGRSIG